MFPIQKVDLGDVAELRLNASDLVDTNLADPKLVGRCYAYAYDGLATEAYAQTLWGRVLQSETTFNPARGLGNRFQR